jgi:hypothetical protein
VKFLRSHNTELGVLLIPSEKDCTFMSLSGVMSCRDLIAFV